jgi:hypothetical protein
MWSASRLYRRATFASWPALPTLPAWSRLAARTRIAGRPRFAARPPQCLSRRRGRPRRARYVANLRQFRPRLGDVHMGRGLARNSDDSSLRSVSEKDAAVHVGDIGTGDAAACPQ